MPKFFGLERQIKADDTVEEIAEKVGLKWDVEEHRCYINHGSGEHSINRKAIIRSDNKHLLTVAGLGWKPVKNKDIIKFYLDVVKEAGAEIEFVGEMSQGKGIWARANTKSGFALKGGDQVNGSVLMASFHQVGHATLICTTPIRVWCENSINLASSRSTSRYRQSHVNEFDFDKALAAILSSKDEMATFEKEARKLSSIKLDEIEATRVFANLFVESDETSDKFIKHLIDDPDSQPLHMKQVLHSYVKAPGASPGNAWGVLNAVTHWADHVVGNSDSSRFRRSMFGDVSRIKEKTKSLLLAM